MVAFPKDSYKKRSPSPPSQSQSSLKSLQNSLALSHSTIESKSGVESPVVVSSVVSVESPPVSPSGFSADHEEKGAQEDIRQDAQLRKRAWSFEWNEGQQIFNMPGTLTSLGKTTVDSIECVRSCDQKPYLQKEEFA